MNFIDLASVSFAFNKQAAAFDGDANILGGDSGVVNFQIKWLVRLGVNKILKKIIKVIDKIKLS